MAELHITTVVINCLSYTKTMIDSIKTKHKYHLRVMDQESSDGTQEWCAEQGIDCYRFSPRVSLSQAWNFAIREDLKDEQCKYIFVPNNDVIFHKHTIDNLIDAINKTGYAMVTGSNVAPQFQGFIDNFRRMKVDNDDSHDMKPITNWREEGPDFSCFMITPQTIKDVGLFDENFYPAFHEDNDYHLRILKAG